MPNRDSEIVLVVEGLRYEGWKEIEVVKSLNNLTTTFGFLISDKYPGDANRWPIKLGQPCSIEVNQALIAKGYIDEMNVRYDAISHSLNFAGRDATGDLIDCCHYYDGYKNEWIKQTILSIVQSLCDHFDIIVNVDEDVESDAAYVVPTFKSNEGDRVIDLIVKVCLKKAILPVSYGDGHLTLTRAGGAERASDDIEIGWNVLSGEAVLSNLERYDQYIVKGQGKGNDDKDLASIVQSKGTAEDNIILRHRPLVLLSESMTTNKECENRARWESRLRFGKSRAYRYELQGWLQSNGKPWPLNGKVRIRDSYFGIDSEYLISDIDYRLSSDEGRKVTLTVVDPTTYELLDASIEADKKSSFDYEGPKRLYGPDSVTVENLGEYDWE